VRESGFAVQTKRHDAPGDSHSRLLASSAAASAEAYFSASSPGLPSNQTCADTPHDRSFDLGKLLLALEILVLRLKK